MKRLSIPLRLASMLLAFTLLAACGPGELPGPSQEEIEAAINTSVAQTIEAQGAIATSVAMTVEAKEAEAAAVQNTQTAAAIPSPTNTLATVSIFETNTPLPLPSDTPSSIPVTDEPIYTPTPKAKYICDASTQNPENKAEVKPGQIFKIKIIIVNTGSRPWRAGVDVKYSGGSQMTSVTRVEIPNALQPGEQYTIALNAVAPNEQGLQYMTWTVEGGLCTAFIAIVVK